MMKPKTKHFSPSSWDIQPIYTYILHILYIHSTVKICHLLSHPWNQLETHVQNIRPQMWWQQSNLRPNKPGQTCRASSMHLWNIAACSDELARSKMSFQFTFHWNITHLLLITYGATASANSKGVEDGENVGERRVLFLIREAIKRKSDDLRHSVSYFPRRHEFQTNSLPRWVPGPVYVCF